MIGQFAFSGIIYRDWFGDNQAVASLRMARRFELISVLNSPLSHSPFDSVAHG